MKKRISAFIASVAMLASTASVMPAAVTAKAEGNLPAKVDLPTDEATKEFFPEVFNQEQLGSCVACATTYYQFTYEARKALREADPDADINFSYSPASVYPMVNMGVDTGTWDTKAYNVLKNRGALTTDQVKYDGMSDVNRDNNNNREPKSIRCLYAGEYNNLSCYEKTLYEPFELNGYTCYRRIGEYITAARYNALSESDKKYYVPVTYDSNLYWRVTRIYRAIPNDTDKLFDALNIRLDSYEGCSLTASSITENGYSYWNASRREREDMFINRLKEYLSEGKVVATSANFNYDLWLCQRPVLDENGKETGETAVFQNASKNGYRGHEITIVGYDDSIICDINNNGKIDEGERGAFKVANSWGSDFVNDGYIWVMYDAVRYDSAVENCPAPEQSYTRTPAFQESYKIDVALKENKIVSEVEVLTNNYYDVKIDNSCGDHYISTNAITTSTYAPVVYGGSIFTDITELCSDYRGDKANGRAFRVNVGNKNSKNNTRIVVKAINLRDNKGNIVAREEYVSDDMAGTLFSNTTPGNTFEEYISISFPKGDMNYDGVFDENDYDMVNDYFGGVDTDRFSTFQLELLDANSDGSVDSADFDILSENM